MTTWTTSRTHPAEPDAVILLREYLTELVRRYHRRSDLPGEVDAALAESPSDDLTAPTGLLLLAHLDGELAGCAGLRWRPHWAELTRVYVRPAFRGRGGGAALLTAVEGWARPPTGSGWAPATTWSRLAPCTPATATSRSRTATTTGTPSTGSSRRCGQS